MFNWLLNWIGYNGSTTLTTPQQYVLAAACVVGAVCVIEGVELLIKAATFLITRGKR